MMRRCRALGRAETSTSNWRWVFWSGREMRWVSRFRSTERPSTFSAWCWSTTGVRATFRNGSISRSGPFLAKNFATSISPWVVTLDALAPFRVAGPTQEPAPLPYLQSTGNWNFDINLEVWLQTAHGQPGSASARSNSKHLYWNICQQLAHHTVNGCNMRPGDLLASGTISGPTPDSFGSLLELTWRGHQAVAHWTAKTRTLLARRRSRDDDGLVSGTRIIASASAR